jgi:outer membrane lipoprotein
MKISVLLLCLFCVVGCTDAIPRQYLAKADPAATYPAVKENVNRYMGDTVAWGGTIQQLRNTPEGTYIEVVESPLDGRGRPESIERTRGRFLILYPGFAEPALYAQGKLLTVIGQIHGVQSLPLGEITYSYPVVLREYDHLWSPQSHPDVHLGIGVGAIFHD